MSDGHVFQRKWVNPARIPFVTDAILYCGETAHVLDCHEEWEIQVIQRIPDIVLDEKGSVISINGQRSAKDPG